ncbi:MAG: protein kinase [Ruminococcus sp.]|jgi:serine/threonine protein kinase|nr:protein kinase [Ruminococcus sp.]
MKNIRICPNCYNGEISDEKCPVCGFVPGGEAVLSHTLPVGTSLQERYFVGKVLGEGGFGITYVGFDTRLDMKVAIKEYYPVGYANRKHNDNTHSVYSYVGYKTEVFEKGMERFIKEARRLSKFAKEPGVVTVTDFFNENNTAYIVMEYVEGDSLKDVLAEHGKIAEKSVLEMLEPIISTLEKMHKAGIIHRDIAPDNIMLESDGKAKLIDFGAAAEVEASSGKSTIAIVKSGFAPEEQYDNNRDRQGSWTDVYEICATMYAAIEGTTPPDAIARLRGVALPPMNENVSEKTRTAIENGLIMAVEKRTQTMGQLLSELHGEKSAETVAVKTDEIKKTAAIIPEKTAPIIPEKQEGVVKPANKFRSYYIAAGAIAAVIIAVIGISTLFNDSGNAIPADVAITTTSEVSVPTTSSVTTTVTTTLTPTPTTTTTTVPTTITTTTTTAPTTTTTTTTAPPTTTTAPSTTTAPPTTTTAPPTTTTPRPTTTTAPPTTTPPPTTTAKPTTTAPPKTTIIAANIDITDEFTDENFRNAVREELKISEDTPIMSADVAKITEFRLPLGRTEFINGIEYFTSLKILNIGGCDIIELPRLPEGLRILDCSNNEISSIAYLPNSLRELNCSDNRLKSLPELPIELENLVCASNELTTLPDLPPGLINLSCGKNNLTKLSYLPSSIQYLYCDSSAIKSLHELPNEMISLDLNWDKDISLPVLPNSLKSLWIWGDSVFDRSKIYFEDGTTVAERVANNNFEMGQTE